MSDIAASLEADRLRPGQPGYTAALWSGELDRAERAFEDWTKDADKVVKRYALDADEMRKEARYNVLWSNVETLAPALYANPPKVVAARRYLDKDPIGRIACRIIQRAVQYQIDTGEIHDAVKMAVMDRLLGGRGQVWCRYEPTIEGGEIDDKLAGEFGEYGDARVVDEDAAPDDGVSSAANQGGEPNARADIGRIAREVVHVDYVHWKDFRHDPARTWDEVTWVARRAYMTRAELVERFGDVGRDVPLTRGPDGEKADRTAGAIEELRKAEVWEVWSLSDRKVIWLSQGVEDVLDERSDPYRLESFFPCPKPLYATITNDKLVPVPDYRQYEPQAKQMDALAQRIDRLTDAMRVRGAYDTAAPELSRILKGDENDLIAVDRWAEFAQQGGGLKGSIDFLPLEIFGTALQTLFKVKDQVKADIFETTGISDILRGQGDPDETATGVQAKGHFATLRLKNRQQDVARFVRDVVRIMAEMTCELFQPETLADMASCQEMDELQIPAPMPPPPVGGLMGISAPPPGVPLQGGPGPMPGMPAAAGAAPPQKLPMMAAPAPGIGV